MLSHGLVVIFFFFPSSFVLQTNTRWRTWDSGGGTIRWVFPVISATGSDCLVTSYRLSPTIAWTWFITATVSPKRIYNARTKRQRGLFNGGNLDATGFAPLANPRSAVNRSDRCSIVGANREQRLWANPLKRRQALQSRYQTAFVIAKWKGSSPFSDWHCPRYAPFRRYF